MSISPERLQRVIYAKYLLRRAQSLHAEGNELASAEAVLVTHDAVEMLLRVVIDETGAKPVHEFLKCWDSIEDAAGTMPPSKAAMDRLNHTRNGFKHKGIPPNPATVGDHLKNAVIFCDEASRQYFNLDFDSVSLADLIQHSDARTHVKAAEDAKVRSDIETALKELGLGWDALFKVARAKHDSGLVGAFPRRLFSRLGASSEVNDATKWLDSVATTLDSIVLGVEPAKLRRFNKITPMRQHGGGETLIVWTRDATRTSDEDYAFCHTFVIDFALHLLTA